MAAPMAARRQFLSMARILSGMSHLGRAPCACAGHDKCHIICFPPSSLFHSVAGFLSKSSPITVTEEPDTLFQKVSVLVKSHDKAVLDSYEFFVTTAAQELSIRINKVFELPRDIERFSLLKSIHIFKKHRVQYEMRTHYRCIELCHLTGSTAQVYLEYIQRNLPEGVAMAVTKTAMEKVPDHILNPLWEDHPIEEKPSQ